MPGSFRFALSGLLCAAFLLSLGGRAAADSGSVWASMEPRFRDAVEAAPERPVHATLRFESMEARRAAEASLRSGRSGGAVRITAASRVLMEIEAPGAALRALAGLEGLRLIREPFYPVPDGGEVVSEGVERIFLEDWHALGLTGEGITVVVLDSGFQGYEDLLGTELPDTVETNWADIFWSSTPHGTACAEIVHDIAPDAAIELWQATTSVQIMEIIDELIERGDVQVVTFSAGFPGVFPADGSSDLSRAVEEARDAGITFVTSAGNFARNSWSGTVEDMDGDGLLELDGLEDVPIRNAGGTARVRVRWEDVWEQASRDIDLVMYDENGAECARAQAPQNGSGIPFEEASCATGGRATLNLVDSGDAAGLRVWLWSEADLPNSVREPAGSVSVPADSFGALAVGAVRPNGDIAGFSSHGPSDDGRVKPDLSAPTWVSTLSYGNGGFGGTSASAPHAAGFAALLRAVYPWADAVETQWLLELWTEDKGEPGEDNVFGVGSMLVDVPPMELGDPDAVVEPEPEPVEVIEEAAACSCAAGRGGGAAPPVMLLVLGGWLALMPRRGTGSESP